MNRSTKIPKCIESPPRSSGVDAAILLSVVAALSLGLAVPAARGKLAFVALAGLPSFAVIRKAVFAIHVALLTLLWLWIAPVIPPFRVRPLSILVPFVVYGGVVASVRQLRHSVGWVRTGEISPKVLRLILATILASAVALVGWVKLANPDIERHLSLVPELPLWVYPFAGVGFAIFNAAMEEAIFRGIIMEALDSALGGGYWSVGFQAIPFAALHYLAGFPSGIWGFSMVLVYGILLGAVRRLSRGMLAPFTAHVAADITIFSILLFLAISGTHGHVG